MTLAQVQLLAAYMATLRPEDINSGCEWYDLVVELAILDEVLRHMKKTDFVALCFA